MFRRRRSYYPRPCSSAAGRCTTDFATTTTPWRAAATPPFRSLGRSSSTRSSGRRTDLRHASLRVSSSTTFCRRSPIARTASHSTISSARRARGWRSICSRSPIDTRVGTATTAGCATSAPRPFARTRRSTCVAWPEACRGCCASRSMAKSLQAAAGLRPPQPLTSVARCCRCRARESRFPPHTRAVSRRRTEASTPSGLQRRSITSSSSIQARSNATTHSTGALTSSAGTFPIGAGARPWFVA